MTRPLHVLWLIDHVCYDGSLHGGGRLFRNLVPEFNPQRVRVFPYFLRASAEVRRVFDDAPVRVSNLDKGKYDPTTLFTLWRLCRRHRIDVMHLYCYASATFGRLVGAACRIPTVIHDFDTQIYFPYPFYLATLDRLLARSTGRGLAASPMTRAYMVDVRHVPRERTELMSHAVPLARFSIADPAQRTRSRAQLGFAPDECVFLAATKLGPDRGNELLLRAFARTVAQRPRARLVIVYKPTYYHRVPDEYRDVAGIRDTAGMRKALDELVTTLGIAERVAFVESLDQPESFYAACDALVVPFLHERFSSVQLLEAFACGRPAVATDLGEQRVLIEHERNGLLVPAGDEDALTRALVRMIDAPQERERMGAAAARTAAQHSIRAAADRLSDLYLDLARPARKDD